jgi:outer membrane biosynthesis protein TonB
MIQEVSVESTQAPATQEPAEPEPLEAPEVRGRSPQPVPEEPQEPVAEESQEPEEPPPPPVPKTRVPPRIKPKPKAEPTQGSSASSTQASAPKAKAKRAPRKPKEEGSSASVRNPPPDETDRFASFSNTDLMSEMLKRTDQGERRNSTLHTALIAEIIARSNDHRIEQKRAMYRSFLQ